MRFYTLGQLSNDEKSDILGKHREVYNGYKRMQNEIKNEQPLYVQDFANDKEGITVNGSGEVSSYNNKIYMKESKEVCSECGGMMYEGECSECGGGYMEEDTDEGIYDVEDINPKNEFDYTKEDFEYEQMESAFGEELDEISGPSPLYSDIDFEAYDFKSDGPNQAQGPFVRTEEELDELSPEDLVKGKKYKYKSPSFEDDIEFEDEYPTGGMYGFKGDKMSHSMGGKHIEDFVSDIDLDDLEDYGEKDTAPKRIERGMGDVEDIDWEEIDEDIKESFITQKTKINEMFNRMNRYN